MTCNGCGRRDVIYTKNFPDDYPIDKMLCCACTASYYYNVKILMPSNIRSYCEHFYIGWWTVYGEGIEKAMRLQ